MGGKTRKTKINGDVDSGIWTDFMKEAKYYNTSRASLWNEIEKALKARTEVLKKKVK